MRLNELRTTDLKSLSDFVGEMNLCADSNEMESFVHGNLLGLVDGDVSVWNEVSMDGDILYGSTWPQFDEQFWTRWVPALVANLHDHPFVNEIKESPTEVHASRMSDYSAYTQYLKSALFNEVYAEWDCGYLCISSFNTGHNSQLAFQVNRSSSDFSSRDLQVFKALAVHSNAAYKKLQLLEFLDRAHESYTCEKDSESTFWLSLGPFLYIRNTSNNGRKILSETFPRMSSGFQLPFELKERLYLIVLDWNTSDLEIQERTATFDIHDASRYLSFEFFQTDGLNYRLNGQDQNSRPPNGPLIPSQPKVEKLTNRELEVLHWICEGKTNPEIAVILQLRPKTVEKHLSAIFDKLALHSRVQLIQQFGTYLVPQTSLGDEFVNVRT